MKRRLLNLATVISLMVGVAVSALWIRSVLGTPLMYDRLRCDGETRTVLLDSAALYPGHVAVFLWREPIGPSFTLRQEIWGMEHSWRRFDPPRASHPLLIGHPAPRPSPDSWFYSWRNNDLLMGKGLIVIQRTVSVRLWVIVFLAAVLPMLWAARTFRVSRRVRSGCCHSCGYDLRESPAACPECGTPRPSST
jgi:hypothetical protein